MQGVMPAAHPLVAPAYYAVAALFFIAAHQAKREGRS